MAMALPTTALSQPGQASPPLQQIDGGPAVPVSPYFSHLIAGDDQQGVLSGVAFPLVSRLKPGVLRQPAAVLEGRWLTQPLFLVGGDDGSYLWLHRHGEGLRRTGAAGIVLSAANEAAFKRMQKLAGEHGLPIAPGPDAWLEQQLLARGVGVLPVLIGTDGRARQEAP